MVNVGDAAPDFTAPLVTDAIDTFSLADALEDGPVVLAFFPGAFTSVCTAEMESIEADLSDFEAAGASVYGVSVDTPFSLREFRSKKGLSFGLISDSDKQVIQKYGVEMELEDKGNFVVAKRSVFVVDGDGTVTYAWVSEDSGVEPAYEEVKQAAADAA